MLEESNRDPLSSTALQTLDKGLLVLEVLAANGHEGLSLSDLARQLGMHKSSLYRVVTTLLQRGYLERRESDDRYRIGLHVLDLAATLLNDLEVGRIGYPLMKELSQQVHDTIHLAICDQDEVVTVEHIQGVLPLSLTSRLAARRPLYCTAAGKAMLAFMDESVLDRVVSRGLEALTPKTITDPKKLEIELQRIRVLGYALDDEERTQGIRCVGAPIFDYRCEVVGSLSVGVPSARMSIEELAELAVPVTKTARRISQRMGFRPGMLAGRVAVTDLDR